VCALKSHELLTPLGKYVFPDPRQQTRIQAAPNLNINRMNQQPQVHLQKTNQIKLKFACPKLNIFFNFDIDNWAVKFLHDNVR